MVMSKSTDWSFTSLPPSKETISRPLNGSSKLLSFNSITPSNYRLFSVKFSGYQTTPLKEDDPPEPEVIEINKKFADAQLRSDNNKQDLNDFICGLGEDSRTEALAFSYYQEAKAHPEFRPNVLTLKTLTRYLLRCKDWSSISLIAKDFIVYDIFPDISTCSSVVTCCIKSRKFRMAEMLLHMFQSHQAIAVPVFESAMVGYNKLHMYYNTILVFDRMKSNQIAPDAACYSQILEAYSKIGDTDKVMFFFNEFKTKKFDTSHVSTRIMGILCDCLGKAGRAFEALEIFREMTGKGVQETTSIYSHLISAFADVREVKVAEQLFEEAKEKKMGRDPAMFLTLVLMYVKDGYMEKTLEIVEAMKEMNIKVSDCIFCAIINGYSKKRGLIEAVRVYEELVTSGCKPGQVTYASIINVYCRLGLFDKAEAVFLEMEKNGFDKCVVAYSSMISMYGKVGRLKDAMKLMAKMKERGCEPNVWVYNTLINMHGKVNDMRQVEKLWKEMKRRKIKPDRVSYTNTIKAYNMVRDFDSCLRYYEEFKLNVGVMDRAIAGTMVGVFSKSNRIDELVKLLQDMKGQRLVLDARLYESARNAFRDAGLEFRARWFEENFDKNEVLGPKKVRPLVP